MTMSDPTNSRTLPQLLDLYDRAQSYSLALIKDLEPQQIHWRPNEQSSAIGWHLGHQAAVNHYLVRNLTSAEPSFNPKFDSLFDSATTEPERGDLPPLEEIRQYRSQIANSTHRITTRISEGDVGAPHQLSRIADGLLHAVINHEYQHAAWIKEVRDTMVSNPAPHPGDPHLIDVDGYWMVGPNSGEA